MTHTRMWMVCCLLLGGCRSLAGYEPGLDPTSDLGVDQLRLPSPGGRLGGARAVVTGRACQGVLFDGTVGSLVGYEPGAVEIDVRRSGYYEVVARELADTCLSQTAEGGYITVTNGCNKMGWPRETQSGPLLIPDLDNTSPPCPPHLQLKQSDHSSEVCCTPAGLISYGTFWFEAGMNTLTVHHMCNLAHGEWPAELAHLEATCTDDAHSIQLRFDNGGRWIPGFLACAETGDPPNCS